MEGYISISERIPNIRKDEVFIIIPYKKKFGPTLESIKKVCANLGMKAFRADDIRKGLIMNNIIDGILNSEIIIADITERNSNVFFELGLAQAKRDSDVIIISQTHEKAPYDVRNWQILPYKAKELNAFESALREKIELVRNTFGQEKLFSLLLRAYPTNRSHVQDFLELVKKKDSNSEKLNSICLILSDTPNLKFALSELEGLNEYINALAEDEDGKYSDIVNFLKPIIFSSSNILKNYFSFVRQKYIDKWQVDPVTMIELPQRDVSSKICFRVIEMNHPQKKIAVEWLINYLQNKRMGRIDPVRAQIANFLITTKDEMVNDAIRNLLDTKNHGQLEAAIDISGQKGLFDTSAKILSILRNTQDPFVARCCAYALPRLKNEEAGKEIYEWLMSNKDKWGKQAVSANLQSDVLKALGEKNAYYESVANLSSE